MAVVCVSPNEMVEVNLEQPQRISGPLEPLPSDELLAVEPELPFLPPSLCRLLCRQLEEGALSLVMVAALVAATGFSAGYLSSSLLSTLHTQAYLG